MIDRVLAAGGIVHARTTQPEFGVPTFTHSRLWGVTRNPWQPAYSPGGSSGGSAAALAAGAAALATGSDIGGSIRIPAAFSAVVGFKPPHGRVPAAGLGGADPYRTDGPMARTVADCALLQNVLCGPDPHDHHSLRPAYVLPGRFAPVTGVRLALCVRLGDYRVHPEVEKNTRDAAAALAGAGAVVEEITLPWTVERILHAVAPHFAARFGATVVRLADAHPGLLAPYTLRYAEQMRGQRHPRRGPAHAEHPHAQRCRARPRPRRGAPDRRGRVRGLRLPAAPELVLSHDFPVTSNDPATVELVRDAHREAFGAAAVLEYEPLMGSEDFALFGTGEHNGGADIPYAYWFLGGTPRPVWDAAPGTDPAVKLLAVPGNHTARFAPDPAALDTGVTALRSAALACFRAGPGRAGPPA